MPNRVRARSRGNVASPAARPSPNPHPVSISINVTRPKDARPGRAFVSRQLLSTFYRRGPRPKIRQHKAVCRSTLLKQQRDLPRRRRRPGRSQRTSRIVPQLRRMICGSSCLVLSARSRAAWYARRTCGSRFASMRSSVVPQVERGSSGTRTEAPWFSSLPLERKRSMTRWSAAHQSRRRPPAVTAGSSSSRRSCRCWLSSAVRYRAGSTRLGGDP